jgi:hypothetical protein
MAIVFPRINNPTKNMAIPSFVSWYKADSVEALVKLGCMVLAFGYGSLGTLKREKRMHVRRPLAVDGHPQVLRRIAGAGYGMSD